MSDAKVITANPDNPKEKFGKAKPSIEFVSPGALLELARVMELGAKKYGAFNWRKKPVKASTYYSAMYRHMALYFSGQQYEPESGAHELAHAMACCMILIDAEAHGKLIDDRPISSHAADVIARLTQTIVP